MRAGFIGLGNMGQAMARNLINAGHDLIVYNRTRSRADELAREGAAVAGSPAEVCAAGVVMTMLADDSAAFMSLSAPSAWPWPSASQNHIGGGGRIS
jgi:3-hydroxyisobutyrate dehydrogenase-like beta-hydroxyacid dehydrogenase